MPNTMYNQFMLSEPKDISGLGNVDYPTVAWMAGPPPTKNRPAIQVQYRPMYKNSDCEFNRMANAGFCAGLTDRLCQIARRHCD
jgi:hypothetical protein